MHGICACQSHGMAIQHILNIRLIFKYQLRDICSMASKEFIHQRICAYAGKEIDPAIDMQVSEFLRNKFNIHLPQRRSINESLEASISDHEIISLLLQYRTMNG